MKSLLKSPIKCPLTVKSRIIIDICNGLVGIKQETAGIVQSHLIQVLVKVSMEGSGKYSGKRIRTKSQLLCHRSKRNFLCKMSRYISHRLIYNIFRSHRTFFHQSIHRQSMRQHNLYKCLRNHNAIQFFSLLQ